MKHCIRAIILAFSLLILCSCGNKKEIGYYNYASYDELATSTSAEYSLAGKKIYIEGKLSGFEMFKIDDVDYLSANIEESNGKKWIVKIGQAGMCSDENLTAYIGTKIRCFGKFLKKIDNTPVLELNIDGEYCIQKCKGGKTICSYEDFKPSISYINSWFGANAEGVIFKEVADVTKGTKKPGAYYSDGILDGLDDKSLFHLYQKDGNYLTYSYVHYSDGDNCIIPITDFQKMKDGDAVRIYFVIDERKQCNIIYFRSTYVDYTLNKDDTKPQLVFEKEYHWEDIGTIAFKVYFTEATGETTVRVGTIANDYKAMTVSIIYFLNAYENVSYGYSVNTTHSETNEEMDFHYYGTIKGYYWKDKLGNLNIEGYPSWYKTNGLGDDAKGAEYWLQIDEIYNEFQTDYPIK